MALVGKWLELLVPDTLIDHRKRVIGAINNVEVENEKIQASMLQDIPQSQVTGLSTALGTKLEAGDLTTALSSYSTKTDLITNINALSSGTINKARISNLDMSQITNLSTTFDTKADKTDIFETGKSYLKAGLINDKYITTAMINDSAVGSTQLKSKAVTQEKIADTAVGSGQLAANAVTSAKINNGAVTTEKISINADLDFGGKVAKNIAVDSGSDLPQTASVGQLFIKKTSPADRGVIYYYTEV